MNKSLSRRNIIKNGFLAAIGSSFITKADASSELYDFEYVNADPEWQGFKVGIASYSFRKMSLEDTIKALKRLDLHYISAFAGVLHLQTKMSNVLLVKNSQ